MPPLDRSSPAPAGFNNVKDEIAYYKSQYEQLEVELQEFQASSRELEAELERDVEASEKRERGLKEKVESLNYEVEEWKTKYKQSKTEASNAQNALQKEITSLRDTNRTQQLRLRDIEVANDDFERQARHTTSSLEDLESKYNVTLERGVMLEEEIKTGEQEREKLRIEAQRLRDELSDLKIEADITQERLRAAEAANELHPKRVSQLSESKEHGLHSPASEGSVTSASMASNFTPPITQSESSAPGSDAPTPPSPPLSETFAPQKTAETAQPQSNQHTTTRDLNVTPKPAQNIPARTPHSRSQSRTTLGGRPPAFKPRSGVPLSRPNGAVPEKLPRTESLYQVKGLIGKIQKLEMRVQSAKSKLPAPTNTPPKASPRGANTPVPPQVSSNVTIRSNKKRSSASTNASATPSRPSEDNVNAINRRNTRTSFGGPRGVDGSRPSSRASAASHSGFARPSSRIETSNGGSESEFKRPQSAADMRRPPSSMSGAYTPSQGHRQSQGVFAEGDDKDQDQVTPTPRKLNDRNTGGSAIPAPGGLGRRQSAQALAATPGRRRSTKTMSGVPRSAGSRQSTDLGETF